MILLFCASWLINDSGPHVYSVIDNNGCSFDGSFEVTQPERILFFFNWIPTFHLKCKGIVATATPRALTCSYDSNTASFIVSATGGSAPYKYSVWPAKVTF